MIQLPRVGWKLLACENGASPYWILVVVVSNCALRRFMSTRLMARMQLHCANRLKSQPP